MEGIASPILIIITGKATGGTTDMQQGESTGYRFQLFQNYPNPFNPATEIGFELPSASFVTLMIFDMMGREVKTLISEELQAGHHTCRWDAAGLANGVYFYRLVTGGMMVTKRLLLLK
jgi:hypothetical protein